jgi:Alw26I/Eco31I/Esp3I family type II restriction endonuclease
MARAERSWNSDFEKYMEEIASHPNYRGLPIERKRDGSLAWFAFATGELGQARKRWAEDKAHELGFPVQPGVYARVMREIHPTKHHICQICGSRMSIYYHYPSVNFLKAISREFGLEFTECDHIGDIWEQILDSGVLEDNLRLFFQRRFELPNIQSKDKNEIIAMCESKCREDGKALLSPGAMSNFPDRFDGFHTYNRCCRATQDTGRSRENLKSYTKDRRAYEYWSDGNIHAADMFMGSQFFSGRSADHIGPISLGFVHDPRYLRPMTSSDNSTKRDRLLVEDIEAILVVEAATGVYPMSWYSSEIWEFIKANYRQHPDIVATRYRDILKQNMANFMFVLKTIYDKTVGHTFLYKEFIESKYESFLHTYEFDELGNIVKQTPRRFTERSNNEIARFARIAFESVRDYSEKDNRHLSPNLTQSEKLELVNLCGNICISGGQGNLASCRRQLEAFIRTIQQRLIRKV